jgi:hypothetical protein
MLATEPHDVTPSKAGVKQQVQRQAFARSDRPMLLLSTNADALGALAADVPHHHPVPGFLAMKVWWARAGHHKTISRFLSGCSGAVGGALRRMVILPSG